MIQMGNKDCLIGQIDSTLPEPNFILIEKSGNQFIIIMLYVPPSHDLVKFVKNLDKELEFLEAFKVPIVLMGDFNIDTLREVNLQPSY